MRLLLDTHIFLWFISGDSRLSEDFRYAITDPENSVFLSVASLWEIIIKNKIGRLPLPESPEIYIPRQREVHRIESLPITETNLQHLSGLPNHHNDPFDRCLISQALEAKLILVTVDREIMKYDVEILKR